MDDLNYYNQAYLNSLEYRKNPEDSMYYDIWLKISQILDNQESIIEIGCGSGQLGNLLISNSKKYLYGFDYSDVAIELAKKINSNDSEKFIILDLYTIKNKLDSNTIICTEVLEHLEDDYFVFGLMEVNTRFIFSVPNFWYKTHKRIYNGITDIENRYNGLININDCYVYEMNKNKYIYLIDSIII